MSTVRRSKAMPTDGPTVKFLYTIIKQLDLKSIDWGLVASQLEISNGHAARMRYSRFRQQMEGITSTPRARTKKGPKGSKIGSCKADLLKEADSSDVKPVLKQEPQASTSEPTSYIKTDPHAQEFPALADIPVATYHIISDSPARTITPLHSQMTVSPNELTTYSMTPSFLSPTIGFEHQLNPAYSWPPTKLEPDEENRLSDVFVKVEEPQVEVVNLSGSEVEYCGLFAPGLKIAEEPKD
ncbi:hypothetical protein BDV32DRAFT_144182 [Aspergillus pseudonomiae]|uniref:Myb-like DNA-binding domain-containing protein n=1 Tax=Aspergillus pseudonomiae TaxID=1506151 RepID=A0A5N6IFX9_9EURO|nr:uncharacterized protein BDV37DRAFT_281542 [Aspergillus pseudonomiae]KAB8265661.1 hypothetical protein BDV32DRAFT_144182 [Aspergillus pseudonomiae]KAE8405707.1 hypothetical protein BDV37DRAFT_281542 [Aspergillus pseudonomiae]